MHLTHIQQDLITKKILLLRPAQKCSAMHFHPNMVINKIITYPWKTQDQHIS